MRVNWKEIDKSRHPYKVPDGYFQHFSNNIRHEIAQQEKKRKVVRARIYSIFSATVAAVAILAIIIPTVWETDTPQAVTQSQPQPHNHNEAMALESNTDYIYDYLMLNTNIIYQYETEDE